LIDAVSVFRHPTFYPLFPAPLFQVFLYVVFVVAELSPENVVFAVEPEVFVPVFAAAELSPEVVALADEPAVSVLVFAAAELSPEVVVLAVEPEVVVLAAEPGVVFVSGPQASVDIAVAFVVLVPVSVVVVWVDSPEHPKFLAFPNVDYYSSSSSSVEVVFEESVHSSIGARTNYGLCSILSNLGLHQNKNLEHCYNNPSPGYNNVSDTNDLPTDATTNHSRRRGLHQYQGRRKHTYQAALSTPVVRQIQWAADQY